MQVFEFYFNPKARKDRFFEVFSLEPEKDFSRGSLYLVGELANTLPQNSGLLQKFAKVVSHEYSSSPTVKSQDAFFRMLLKKANDFFSQELHRGNVDWLGNLHLALLYVKNSGKRSSVMFAKTGGIKAFMARGTNVVDLGKNLQSSSHGAELFASSVSAHAFAEDKIVVLTKDVCDALAKENGLSDLSTLSHAKRFQMFLKQREKMFSRLSGILFAVLMEEFISQSPPLYFLKRNLFSLKLPRIQIPISRLLRFPISSLIGKLRLPTLQTGVFKQEVVITAVFLVLLIGGFFTFQGEKKELQRETQTIVLQIRVIQKEGSDALELNDVRSANILLQEAWKKADRHTGKEVPLRETFLALKEELEQQLFLINGIQRVENLSALVDIREEDADLIPQNILLAQGNLYLFNPFSSEIFIFNLEEKKGKAVSTSKAIRYGIPFSGSALFFAEPNMLLRVGADAKIETFELKDLPSFGGIAGFDKNLYVFNFQQGEIVKYEDPLGNASVPSVWMNEESLKKPIGARSVAIDGNVWVLVQDNTLQRYFGGLWQEDVKPLVFPLLKGATRVKVFPGLPYVYVLDPSESRVVLFDKAGDLVKQYLIDVPGSLLDFTVSGNGNTLYLLAGSRVFAIEQE